MGSLPFYEAKPSRDQEVNSARLSGSIHAHVRPVSCLSCSGSVAGASVTSLAKRCNTGQETNTDTLKQQVNISGNSLLHFLATELDETIGIVKTSGSY